MRRALAEVVCNRAASDAVRRGHPWVWQSGIVRAGTRGAASVAGAGAGDAVEIADPSGAVLGRGIYDPSSPIAVRVWTRDPEPIDRDLFCRRIERAFAIRERLFGEETTAYRLLHGEGDRTPGMVVDRYGTAAVLRVDGAAAEAWATSFADALRDPLGRLGVRTLARKRDKRDPKSGGAPFEILFGPEPPATIHVREHGVPFAVDLWRGQKTGAFLDQRENRRRVAGLSRARTVCNLFSYAGGFSLHAALGGASRVTSVDVASAAHATAQQSFALAGVDPKTHELVTADVFDFLARAKREGRAWDVVISDPPSFAPSEKALPRALAAYRALHKACAEVLAPGGTLCAASCSSHVDAGAFLSTLDDTALGRSDLRMLELFGPPADHPSLPAFPEGRYLKFAVLE